MKIYPGGTEVITKLGGIKGTITAATIRFDFVSYELTFFSNGDYKTVWVYEAEFTTAAEKETIGFIK